jgi:hypothetical protein
MVIIPVLVTGFISAVAICAAYAIDAVKNRMPNNTTFRF